MENISTLTELNELYETEFDIIIGTTAVTRSDLHSITFPKYLDFIEGLNALWIINIDSIMDEDPEFTKQNILKICEGKSVKIIFNISNSKTALTTFWNAALFVINTIPKFRCKYGVLWLEDDWEYFTNQAANRKLINFGLENIKRYTYIQLVERGYLTIAGRSTNNCASFNPGFWEIELFNHLMVDRINAIDNSSGLYNPEHATLPDEAQVQILHHLQYPCFRDIGRAWQDKTIKTRTFKYNN
jgi:hypothetical protein